MQVHHKATLETTVSIRLYLCEQFSTWLSFHKPNASRLQNGRNFFFSRIDRAEGKQKVGVVGGGGERQKRAADGKGGEKYNHNRNK